MAKQAFGTDSEGFDVAVDGDGKTLHIRMWGFWTVETSALFPRTVSAACASAGISCVRFDAAQLKPLRDAGQQAFGSVMAALRTYKVRDARVTGAGPLTRLQLLRIAKERAPDDFIGFENLGETKEGGG